MTTSSNPDTGPVALPDEHGFRHALGTEDPGAVAKQYPPTPARDEQTMVRTVYHNGRHRDLQAKGAEFEFQLDGQYQVLAQMPANDYLAARDLFKQQGRQGNELTQQARKELQNKLFGTPGCFWTWGMASIPCDLIVRMDDRDEGEVLRGVS